MTTYEVKIEYDPHHPIVNEKLVITITVMFPTKKQLDFLSIYCFYSNSYVISDMSCNNPSFFVGYSQQRAYAKADLEFDITEPIKVIITGIAREIGYLDFGFSVSSNEIDPNTSNFSTTIIVS